MVDKITFMETLRSVAEIMKTSHEPLSREEIQSYFANMELSEEQQEMVYQYLLTPEEEKEESQVEEEEESVNDSSENNLDELDSYVEEALQKEKEIKIEALADSPFFKMYLEDIKELPKYSKEEMDALYKDLLAGDEYVVQAIADQWLPKVLEISKQYVFRNVNMEDVIQEGNIGLLFGLTNLLGTNQTIDLEGYLTDSIKESMEAFIDEMMTDGDQETTVVAKVTLIHEARKSLTEELGRIPTQSELSQYTKISEEEIKDILELFKEKE